MFQQLLNVGLQGLFSHTEVAAQVEFFFGKEKAVFAAKVTNCSCRFNQYVKKYRRARSYGNYQYLQNIYNPLLAFRLKLSLAHNRLQR